MSQSNIDLSRRSVIARTTAIAAAALLPSWPLLAEATARLPRDGRLLRVSLPPLGPSPSRVNWCRGVFEKAAAHYEAAGETENLQRARWTLYWKLGFLMAQIPNSPHHKLEQVRGFQLLETVAGAYTEVPWQLNLAERLKTYRAWGCDRGRTWDSV